MRVKDSPFSKKCSLQIGEKVIDFSTPKIMGVLNVTPDSFFDGGKNNSLEIALNQAAKMVQEGAEFIDVGGYSSRPGADAVSTKEEIKNLISGYDKDGSGRIDFHEFLNIMITKMS